MSQQNLPLILASQSPTRRELLNRMNFTIDAIKPADIDETPKRAELPHKLADRLAGQKAEKIASEIDSGYIIAADTVAAMGRRILPKAETPEMVVDCLKLVSGRRHKLNTGITVIKKLQDGSIQSSNKLVQTVVKFKRLTEEEINYYAATGEGLNKAGGYAIQGIAGMYISFIRGSFSNVAGLPLHELYKMLTGLGYNYLTK